MSVKKTINVKLPHHSYEVVVAPGSLSDLGASFSALGFKSRCAVLGDETVLKLYGETAQNSLTASGFSVLTRGFVTSETAKSLDTVRGFYDLLVNSKFERIHPIAALGGGIAGDLIGFVAASYLRGIPFIQIPTTLLAMVDASVGGKVGVNVPQGKNLIGAFHQPVAVLIDPQVLKTLPEREFRCGLAECIKHGIIGDRALFDWIKANLPAILRQDISVLTELVARNVEFKARIVMADEFEHGERALLNLGHTFGHAIESTTGYTQVLHGEAVSLGIVAACAAAEFAGRAKPGLRAEVEAVLQAAGLPIKSALPSIETMTEAMSRDKKVRSGQIRLIIPEAIGNTKIVSDLDPSAVAAGWAAICQ